MRSRRPLIWLLASLVIVLGALSATQRDDERARTAQQQVPRAAPGAAERGEVVPGELPGDRVVRARPGDTVVLRVRSEVPDVARIARLGLATAVGPGIPGELSFQALEPGRLAVVLQLSGRRVGTVDVRAAAA
jgi:hypothetical protein